MPESKIPAFGLLQGVRVVHAATSIAVPFAAALMADMGADVIWIENPSAMCSSRMGTKSSSYQDRRNQRSFVLNIPECKEAFLRLLKETDIFMESSKPGQFNKWGLTDEVMWQINPKLVIAHISGYGQSGDPKYYPRASYDGIAQAFGGLIFLNNSEGENTPLPVTPLAADYYCALFTATSCLAGYIRAQKCGTGESIDLAQFEILLRSLSPWSGDYFNIAPGAPMDPRVFNTRELRSNRNSAAYNTYRCKDGNYVYILAMGLGVMKNLIQIFGFEYGSELFPKGSIYFKKGTPAGDAVEAAVVAFCQERTAFEVDEILNANKIPCGPVLDFDGMVDHPHFKVRQTITTWDNPDGKHFKGVNIIPKVKNNPGQIWRGCPTFGMDNEDILKFLGYTNEEISMLHEKGLIAKK